MEESSSLPKLVKNVCLFVQRPKGGFLFSTTDSCCAVLTTIIQRAALEAASTAPPRTHTRLPYNIASLTWSTSVGMFSSYHKYLLLFIEYVVFEILVVWAMCATCLTCCDLGHKDLLVVVSLILVGLSVG